MSNTFVRLTLGRKCRLRARRPRPQGATVLHGRELTIAAKLLFRNAREGGCQCQVLLCAVAQWAKMPLAAAQSRQCLVHAAGG